MNTYRYIAQRASQMPVRQLCQALRVAPAAYYVWQCRRPRPLVEPAWQVAVREAFTCHTQRYGTRRLRAEVQAQGHAVGRGRIRRVLHAHGRRAQQPRSFAAARTTDSDPAVRTAPNRLLGQPAPTAPNHVWVSDSTYLPRQGGGWLYLAVWLDRCSRKIVGFGAAGAARRTCARPCPKTWSAKRSAGPWSYAGPRPGSSCTPT